MDYRMISVDDHIDLGYLPRGLWTERLPKKLRQQGPCIAETKTGSSVWRCEGQNWGPWAGKRGTSEVRS